MADDKTALDSKIDTKADKAAAAADKASAMEPVAEPAARVTGAAHGAYKPHSHPTPNSSHGQHEAALEMKLAEMKAFLGTMGHIPANPHLAAIVAFLRENI